MVEGGGGRSFAHALQVLQGHPSCSPLPAPCSLIGRFDRLFDQSPRLPRRRLVNGCPRPAQCVFYLLARFEQVGAGLLARLAFETLTARRRVSVCSTAVASAPPSAGSVPLPISSSSTSDPAAARSRMSRSTTTCAEKVERLAAIDWRSPMSANTPVKTGSVECGPIGGMMPLCAMRASKPTALMSTVLPPVFGPETRTLHSSGASTRSNGTTASPP